LIENEVLTLPFAERAFSPQEWQADRPLRVVLIGSDFEVQVWETLLKIPVGKATTYQSVARHIGRPAAARAVGAAVGKNPISFVVPCHRVVAADGLGDPERSKAEFLDHLSSTLCLRGGKGVDTAVPDADLAEVHPGHAHEKSFRCGRQILPRHPPKDFGLLLVTCSQKVDRDSCGSGSREDQR
jgi:O-6-methylguanine DNA methyltransferase